MSFCHISHNLTENPSFFLLYGNEDVWTKKPLKGTPLKSYYIQSITLWFGARISRVTLLCGGDSYMEPMRSWCTTVCSLHWDISTLSMHHHIWPEHNLRHGLQSLPSQTTPRVPQLHEGSKHVVWVSWFPWDTCLGDRICHMHIQGCEDHPIYGFHPLYVRMQWQCLFLDGSYAGL